MQIIGIFCNMYIPIPQWIYIMKKDVFRIHFYFIFYTDFREGTFI